jgi:pimeloyl-ACP methyl ester carboxylesterase
VNRRLLGLSSGLQLALRSQGPSGAPTVLYVHGSTFGCDLSLFWRMDGSAWADVLVAAGFQAWGFDLLGYGASSRYPDDGRLHGTCDEATQQLLAVLDHLRAQNQQRPVHLLAHSWGCTVAARAAVLAPGAVASLSLFGPVTQRPGPALALPTDALRANTVWAQYRRFVEDVPGGHAQVLDEGHFDAWARAYLATDAAAASRRPPAVQTPNGPAADMARLWSGQALFAQAHIDHPLLIVRGAWDSVCLDGDAAHWLARSRHPVRRDVVIPAGTHLLHLESGRHALHSAVNAFLLEQVSP